MQPWVLLETLSNEDGYARARETQTPRKEVRPCLRNAAGGILEGVWPSRMGLPPDSIQSGCWEAPVWFLKSSSKRIKCHKKTYIIIMITLSSTVGQTLKKKKNSTATLVFTQFLSFLRPGAWHARFWASGPWTVCLLTATLLHRHSRPWESHSMF